MQPNAPSEWLWTFPSIKRIYGSGDSEVCFCGRCESCWDPNDTVWDYADPTSPLWEVAYVDEMHNRLCFHDLPYVWFFTDPREFDKLENKEPCTLSPPRHLTGSSQRIKQHGTNDSLLMGHWYIEMYMILSFCSSMTWNLRHVHSWQVTPLPFLRYHYVKDVSCGKMVLQYYTYSQPPICKYLTPHNDWHALVRRVSGLILVAWRQYMCPLSWTVLIEFRNGISDERLTAVQMRMKDWNVRMMLGHLKDQMVRMKFWSGKQCISNAYDLCIYHPWIWPSKPDVEVEGFNDPCTNTNSERQTSSTVWEYFFFDANHRSNVVTFTFVFNFDCSDPSLQHFHVLCHVMHNAFDVLDAQFCFRIIVPLMIIAWCEGVGTWQSKKVTSMQATEQTLHECDLFETSSNVIICNICMNL